MIANTNTDGLSHMQFSCKHILSCLSGCVSRRMMQILQKCTVGIAQKITTDFCLLGNVFKFKVLLELESKIWPTPPIRIETTAFIGSLTDEKNFIMLIYHWHGKCRIEWGWSMRYAIPLLIYSCMQPLWTMRYCNFRTVTLTQAVSALN